MATTPTGGSTPVVLHVIAPGAIGGAESVVTALAQARHATGRPTHVAALAPDPDTAFIRGLRDAGVPVHPVVCPHRGYGCEIRGVRAAARSLGATVVHTHVYRADFAGYFAARRIGLPVVATYHGHVAGDWRNRAYEWLDRRLLAWFDAVVCVSAAGRRRLRRAWVPARRLHVIPNGHRPPPLADVAVARERLGIDGGTFTIGWVGRLSREKGADLLLEALAQLPPRSVRAVVIGDGAERVSLVEQARRLQLSDAHTRFAGTVPDAAALFRAFDVLVLSSRTEGLPMVLLEALSAGVPVIAFAVGGIPEVITPEVGWLVPPGDVPALAAAVGDAAVNPGAVRQRADAGQRLFRERFNEGRWVEAYERLYAAVRATTSPGP